MTEIDLIGGPIGALESDYYPGERFIDHISFLGCSPNIALTPEDGEHYCFIRFHPPLVEPHLYSGSNTPNPRCRQCHRIKKNWLQCPEPDFCNQCSVQDRQDNLMWRRQGAFSRWVIEIMNIYPHEAVPSSFLLVALNDVTDVEWGYAYLQA
jgi:hypothetical protein